MLTEQQLSAAIGQTAYGTDGDKIGTVEHFFVDDRTGVPTWVAVTTGLFGTHHSVVPALEATFVDGALRLPVSRDAVRNAPSVGADRLAPADEIALRSHYGLDAPPAGSPTWTPTPSGVAPLGATDEPPVAPAPPPVPAPPIPPAPPAYPAPPEPIPPAVPPPPTAETPASSTEQAPAMTRSEEQLQVTTERVPVTRARLIKYVVTEEVQVTVPIRREEIRIEEVPIDSPDDELGESLVPAAEAEPVEPSSGLPDEIILHSERPVVTVEVVPVERVRLRTEAVSGEALVTQQVDRERIAVEEEQLPGGAPS